LKNSNTVKEDWNAVIAEKLKEGISIEDLAHEYPSGILIEPNVMGSDIEKYNHSISVSKPWINMASINGGSSSDKNKLALLALQQGANGLSFELSSQDSILDILKDILTSYLDVRIDCSQLSSEEIAKQKSLVNQSYYPNLRWIDNSDNYVQCFIEENDRIQSIKRCIDSLKSNARIDVILSLSKNLLFEIASLRALRALLEESNVQSFNILARYEVEGTNELGDYNLIEKTYKVLSGILGGANAILTPYTGDEDSRLTLNIHNVLDLESGMKNVLDPLGGSYYIEKLTGEIISKVKL